MDGFVELVPVGRALLATALGAALGWEREREGHEAGARTYAIVALGACVFGHVSTQGAPSEQTRVAAQVAVGIGFLGGGVILRGRQHVHGLTTAATIWTTAAIGLAVAFGTYLLPIAATAIAYGLLRAPHSPCPPDAEKPQGEKSEPVAQRRGALWDGPHDAPTPKDASPQN
jgi:putative Mg2+ transporter-C (MgtC) family protein